MTLFFRALADVDATAPTLAPLEGAFYDDAKRRESEARFNDWLVRYAARLRHDTLSVDDRAEQGDYSEIHEVLEVMRRPYDDQPGRERYAQQRPDWARERAGCSMLSCSS